MTTAALPVRPSLRLGALRDAAALVSCAAALTAVVAAQGSGAPGVAGVAVGAAVVVGFFVFGAFCTSLAAAYAPSTALMVALLTYTLQVVLLPVVFIGLQRSGATPVRIDPHWLAATVIGGTLLWVVGLLVRAVRTCPAPRSDA